MRRFVFILCLATAAIGGDRRVARSATGITIDFDPAVGSTGRFEVRGLTQEQLAQAKRLIDGGEGSGLLSVHVTPALGPQASNTQGAMLGQHSVVDGRLRFVPRFALEPGTTYLARLSLARLGADSRATIESRFSVPDAEPTEPTRLTHVFPSRNLLPENQLKFYLHFSVPMRQGDSYRHIHLLKSNSTEVDLPFLELGEELWNEDGTRLTVFFDPGRIKRGLKPREEVGPSLEEGHSYTLVIDGDWLDARGRRLQAAHRKAFRVGPPDDKQPDPKRWTLTTPASGSRDPLIVDLGESLDHALLARVVWLRGADGQRMAGDVQIERYETRWRFHPHRPWSAGTHHLVVGTILEDLAGNSVARPFEVDIVRPIEKRVVEESISLPMVIAPAK